MGKLKAILEVFSGVCWLVLPIILVVGGAMWGISRTEHHERKSRYYEMQYELIMRGMVCPICEEGIR